MLDLNSTTFSQVVATAKAAAADSPRWQAAISRASRELQENPFIEWADGQLLIGSASGQSYIVAGGRCECLAYQHEKPCWHRAARQLLARHDQALLQARKRTGYEQAVREMDELYA